MNLRFEIAWWISGMGYTNNEDIECDAKTPEEGIGYLKTYAKEVLADDSNYVGADCRVFDENDKMIANYFVEN